MKGMTKLCVRVVMSSSTKDKLKGKYDAPISNSIYD